MTNRILIVEDEEKIARVLQVELEFEGYEVATAFTGMDGLLLFRQERFDCILLDVMLPEMDGFEVLKRIRASDPATPVLMLTARDSVKDKVEGLDLGANDYITKPFMMEEVFARIRNALRHSAPRPEEPGIRIGKLHLNPDSREVMRNGQLIQLTPREYELLEVLMNHPNQVLSREQLLDGVWGYDYFGDTNVVDVYIRYLRKKIDQGHSITYIQTVRGAGYMLKEKKDEA
ncbi:response regulator transcription factor [Mesobacillus subterraneus]|uniref:DNA-binding response regulator n=1 Tax=Mesobacillus subterraneus TaxID=285983 RepID=A0A3R9FM19_9BACI|nr:response regulator transcription factor [Mesobacillus subterraneus]RSD29544.1 DNA-binding response regulator [Mesobacillus subterraneus]